MFNWIDKLLFRVFRHKWLECSFGELVDKIAILRVKVERLPGTDNRIGDLVDQEMFLTDSLWDYMDSIFSTKQQIQVGQLLDALYKNAYAQWDFEDAMSRIGDDVPIPKRLEAMKGSYLHNRQRAILKKEVDEMFGEKWLEAKHYSGQTQNEGKYKL